MVGEGALGHLDLTPRPRPSSSWTTSWWSCTPPPRVPPPRPSPARRYGSSTKLSARLPLTFPCVRTVGRGPPRRRTGRHEYVTLRQKLCPVSRTAPQILRPDGCRTLHGTRARLGWRGVRRVRPGPHALQEAHRPERRVARPDRDEHVEGVLGPGQLEIGDRRVRGLRASRSAKRRPTWGGTSVSLVPWTTKNGGAPGVMRWSGEARSYTGGVVDVRQLHDALLEEFDEPVAVGALGLRRAASCRGRRRRGCRRRPRCRRPRTPAATRRHRR